MFNEKANYFRICRSYSNRLTFLRVMQENKSGCLFQCIVYISGVMRGDDVISGLRALMVCLCRWCHKTASLEWMRMSTVISGASAASSRDRRGRHCRLQGPVYRAGRASTWPGCSGGGTRRRGRARPVPSSPASRTTLDGAIESPGLARLPVACYLPRFVLPSLTNQTCRHHFPMLARSFIHKYTRMHNVNNCQRQR